MVVKANIHTGRPLLVMRGCSNIPKMLQRCTIAQFVGGGGKSEKKLLNIDRCKYRPTQYITVYMCAMSVAAPRLLIKSSKSLVFLVFEGVFLNPNLTDIRKLSKKSYFPVTETCSSFFFYLPTVHTTQASACSHEIVRFLHFHSSSRRDFGGPTDLMIQLTNCQKRTTTNTP